MSAIILENYVSGKWAKGQSDLVDIPSAVTGKTVAQTSSSGTDFKAMADYARDVGGPALRAMTIHERAYMVKALGLALNERKDELYALNAHTGATRRDGWVDIEGGSMTLFSTSSKARRELPDDYVIIDGPPEQISRNGTWMGQHIYTSMQGLALHIGAYNFPVWGMLEKLGSSLIGGMPSIVKPATSTSYLCEHAVRIMIESGVLPEGALQLIVGRTGDLFDHLGCQDVVSFTGSASTATKLRTHPNIIKNSVRFVAEQDSLNASVLGPDATADSPEFTLFIKEVVNEMTVKAGQKCTAIRRAFVPEALMDEAQSALIARLETIKVGKPDAEGVRMGALVSQSQRTDVRNKVKQLSKEAKIVFGNPDKVDVVEANDNDGAFLSPILLRCDTPWEAPSIHSVEAFGPVSTLMPYQNMADAIRLCNEGLGSLVMSIFTYDPNVAREIVLGSACFHGRIAMINRDNAKESTGHGSPLPVLVHGGPGRAGGGEEMGGARGIKHYMQRTAIQGTPELITGATKVWMKGALRTTDGAHPFRFNFDDLEIGKTLLTKGRIITLEDIEHFAEFTGDNFYAHMDEEAAKANPFFPGRVAHGYLLISFAAGLFVDAAPGPVLANTGLENLRFLTPVSPGDSIRVQLTAKTKKKRNDEYGEVKWDVELLNQNDELVATYDLLTMNAIENRDA
ncbi:MAG: phenylacetic acid degradation bifunctional protein PaaZ [Robiginitomaculum sp.]|nr:MAG: phenylacetic acid degradation bifunctional protein PaaZ [Robiginitomaculum sp.]